MIEKNQENINKYLKLIELEKEKQILVDKLAKFEEEFKQKYENSDDFIKKNV